VAAAVGLARALELALSEPLELAPIRDHFEAGLRRALPEVRVHAGDAPRVGNTSSVLFPGVDGEALLIALDLAGVCASLGAACASGALSPSHVLLAMGVSPADARSSLRFSFGREHTPADADRAVQLLAGLAPKARR
jgi:cysteine desulfurase